MACAGIGFAPGGSGRGGSEAPAAVESPQPTADAAVNQPPAGGTVIGDRPSPTNQPSEPAGTSGDNAGPAAALPDGFQLHTDPTGFTVAVPTGWTRSVEGRVRTSGTGRRTFPPRRPDDRAEGRPADRLAGERTVGGRSADGYERISLDRVEYGWNTADWEFVGRPQWADPCSTGTFGDDARAYALYWSTPESEWADSRGMFDVITQSFQPAPELTRTPTGPCEEVRARTARHHTAWPVPSSGARPRRMPVSGRVTLCSCG